MQCIDIRKVDLLKTIFKVIKWEHWKWEPRDELTDKHFPMKLHKTEFWIIWNIEITCFSDYLGLSDIKDTEK